MSPAQQAELARTILVMRWRNWRSGFATGACVTWLIAVAWWWAQ